MKVLIALCLAISIASNDCVPIAVHAPAALIAHAPVVISAAATGDEAHRLEFDSHPKYEFSYGVQDPLTGDDKEHHESRDGDVVHGSYSLVEADGSRRIVEYTADAVRGFSAVVRRERVQEAAPLVAHHLPIVAHRAHPASAAVTHQATYEFAQHAPTLVAHAPVLHAPAAAFVR